MKSVPKADASAARPVAATVNHNREPAANPATYAGAPRVPRVRTRAISAVTPGPGSSTTARYAVAKTIRFGRSIGGSLSGHGWSVSKHARAAPVMRTVTDGSDRGEGVT